MDLKYLVVIVVPEPWQKRLRWLQQQYKSERWRILIEPHITLIPPGKALIQPAQAASQFGDLEIDGGPIALTVKGVEQFRRPRPSVVYAVVERSLALVNLRHQLGLKSTGLMRVDANSYRKFNPHITLSNKLSPGRAEEVARSLAGEGIDFKFWCLKLWLFKKSSADLRWERLASLKLLPRNENERLSKQNWGVRESG